MVTEETLQSLNITQFKDLGNRFIFSCPYPDHKDSSPSFSIYKESGMFVCFGCGKKGSLSDLTELKTGHRLDYAKNDFPIYKSDLKVRQLKDINYEIEGEFLSIHDDRQVLDYCWSIGLTDEFIDFFEVKYFRKAKFIDCNITYTAENQPKEYFNRIVIPCKYKGKIYNYECRDYTRRSSKKILYPKNAEPDILFNYDNLDFTKPVFRTEGIKGLSKIWTCYSHNVVSTFGKVIKEHQKKLLAPITDLCDVPDNDENKINRTTGKFVDNIAEDLDIFDEFMNHEYSMAYIPYTGSDPANLTRDQIKTVLDNRKKASEIIVARSKLFEREKEDYLSCLK